MEFIDDDLVLFDSVGTQALIEPAVTGRVFNRGAKIWYASYGSGTPVILLHGGLGHSGNWAHQVPALIKEGHQVILIDSRGHGQSTRDEQEYSYELLASDVLAVMDELKIPQSALIGWSDGACTALVLASQSPSRVTGVLFFGCNMDPSGLLTVPLSDPVLGRCFSRHEKDYVRLSPTPHDFMNFTLAFNRMMKTQPNYSASQLSQIKVPVLIVQSERDEFIKLEHAEYLAQTIPPAKLRILQGVSHFAPLQRPELFNQAVQQFLDHL